MRDTKPRNGIMFLMAISYIVLVSSCGPEGNTFAVSTEPVSPTPIHSPGTWGVVGVYNADHSIMTAGFLDELHVATGGVIGQMGVSSDGAQTWLVTDAMSDCRYGMDILSPELIWSCGGATNVRRSVDGGKTWQALAAFGDSHTITTPCHSASFLDETTGWLANSDIFGTTADGGSTWTMQSIPKIANEVATIDTYLPGEGYLLDRDGRLFYTKDGGEHWNQISVLDLGALVMPPSAYQMAAMRFSDARHGLVVISSSPYGKNEPVVAFHTSDGGATWTSEAVPVRAGPVYLARKGGYLTVITAYGQLTLLKYEE